MLMLWNDEMMKYVMMQPLLVHQIQLQIKLVFLDTVSIFKKILSQHLIRMNEMLDLIHILIIYLELLL